MGQLNNSGRRASLDQHKERAAGRGQGKGREVEDRPAKGKTRGAFGKDHVANRRTSGAVRGGSGSGSMARDSAMTTPPSSRPARKRGASSRASAQATNRRGK